VVTSFDDVFDLLVSELHGYFPPIFFAAASTSLR
jgi:hypothetical protein